MFDEAVIAEVDWLAEAVNTPWALDTEDIAQEVVRRQNRRAGT